MRFAGLRVDDAYDHVQVLCSSLIELCNSRANNHLEWMLNPSATADNGRFRIQQNS